MGILTSAFAAGQLVFLPTAAWLSPWPNGTNTTTMTLPRDDVIIPLLIIIVGAAVVVIVDLLAVRYVHVEPLHEHDASAQPTPTS